MSPDRDVFNLDNQEFGSAEAKIYSSRARGYETLTASHIHPALDLTPDYRQKKESKGERSR
jgi:hypothetical protein